MTIAAAGQVLDFWFVEHGPDDWYAANPAFDAEIVSGFAETHAAAAARSELWTWRTTPRGRLAEIIVLDQFSRQMFRGRAEAFVTDPLALALTQEALAAGAAEALDENERAFLLMPFQHAESLAVQEEGLKHYAVLASPQTGEYARAHRDVIARFGRFPMRNAALGRPSTPEELAYMAERGGRMF